MRCHIALTLLVLTMIVVWLTATRSCSDEQSGIVAVNQPLQPPHDKIELKTNDTLLGFFQNESQTKLIPYTVTVTHEDFCGSGDSYKIFYVESKPEPLFLVYGLPDLKEGEIETVFRGYDRLYPGMEINFEFNKKKYDVRIHGRTENIEGKSYGNFVVKDFSVEFRKRSGDDDDKYGNNYQTIASIPKVVPQDGPAVMWAGDLDKDGELDLLLNLQWQYFPAIYTLFLSSSAKAGEYLKEVGTAYKGFDC